MSMYRFFLEIEGERFTVFAYPSPQVCVGDTTFFFKLTHTSRQGQERFLFVPAADITWPDSVNQVIANMHKVLLEMKERDRIPYDVSGAKLSGSWSSIIHSLWKTCVDDPSVEEQFEVSCGEVTF